MRRHPTAVSLLLVASTLAGYAAWRAMQAPSSKARRPRGIAARLSTATTSSDVALAQLLTGKARAAASVLHRVAAESPSALTWSDAAAASYTSAVTNASPEDLVDALVAVDAALALDPTLPQARFNRALVIERLGLRDLAIAEWNRYLRFDPASEWSMEARAHAEQLSDAAGKFSELLERNYDRIATDPQFAAELGAKFPQEVRTSGDTEILGRWGEAEQTGDAAAAERHLAVARAFGKLAARRGDELLARTVAAIDEATPQRRVVLASAHVGFRAGRQKFQQLKLADAESLYAQAADDFDRGASPAVVLARAFRTNMAYEQGRVDEAAAELARLLGSLPKEFRSCGAQIEWERSLCHAVRGRYGDAIEAARNSMTTFESLGETQYAASMKLQLAYLHDLIGDSHEAWQLRMAALPQLGRNNTRTLHAAVGSIAQTAILRQDWMTAESFLRLQRDAAQLANNDTFVADALLRRALVRRRLGRADAARSDLVAAQRVLEKVTDPGIRLRMEGRLQWVEGDLAETPAMKIALLTRAIDTHRTAVRRMTLPSLLYDRAIALRESGDVARAAADLDEAIAELEAHRESLPATDIRWGVFHGAEEIFDEATELALDRHDIAGAFHYVETARARTLLDALRAADEVSLAEIPEGTAIVEYAVTKSRVIVFLADRSGVRAVTVAAGRKALEKRVTAFRDAISAGDEAAMHDSGRVLHKILIQPIAAWLAPNQTIVVVPDPTLSGTPFAALRTAEGRYAIEERPIVFSPSAAVYTHVARYARNSGAPRLLTLVNDDAVGRQRLSSAGNEASAITRLYRRGTVLSGRDATADAFRREARDADLIHFVGHALTSALTPDDTFLVLKNDAGGEERLDVRQIAEMKLDRGPAVVLAACSTAVGRTSMEGTMSAARAFLAAGASSVFATLWPIDDAEGAEFFVRLHRRLAHGDSPADALQNAQIESIRAGVPPSMWGAVQLMGK